VAQISRYLNESPSQTAGPYVHIGCTPAFSGIDGVYTVDPGSCMVNDDTRGDRITVNGCVYDANAVPLTDALIEIWQADAAGLYPSPLETRGEADPNFIGWGRSPGDMDTGEFSFKTVRPGVVPYPDGRLQAPHITFWIVARGINIGLHTRLYFDDAAKANEVDPILSSIEGRDRKNTLIANTESAGVFRFDIYLQGDRETIFFDM